MPTPSEGFDAIVHDVYPGIAPEKFKDIHQGKVVFITGGGTGLGLAAAKAFSQTGASVFLMGRRAAPLQTAKSEIEAFGGCGAVGIAQVDVTDEKSVKAGVDAAVKRFGKIDIVIANAGKDPKLGFKLAEADVDDWWSTIETNVKGCFLTAHATLPHLVASRGYIILVSSTGAQVRGPTFSSYNLAKHATNRLAEWIDIEYAAQGVKSFSVHPGGVPTDMSDRVVAAIPMMKPLMTDSSNVSAWTYVRLTSGSEDWLSGRFVDATASFDVLTQLKEKIVEQDALKNRLALPI